MALRAATTPLVITLTQGGADAFVQSSVLTGLSGRQAYNVRSFQLELPGSQLLAVSADSEFQVAITRRSKAAMPSLADSDVLFKWAFVNALTTSGEVFFPAVHVHVPDLEVPIVEETLYAQLDSTTLSMTLASVIVRMEVELDTMSDIDRLNLIARSLT